MLVEEHPGVLTSRAFSQGQLESLKNLCKLREEKVPRGEPGFVLSGKCVWNRFIQWIHGEDKAPRVLCPVPFRVVSPGLSECAEVRVNQRKRKFGCFG